MLTRKKTKNKAQGSGEAISPVAASLPPVKRGDTSNNMKVSKKGASASYRIGGGQAIDQPASGDGRRHIIQGHRPYETEEARPGSPPGDSNIQKEGAAPSTPTRSRSRRRVLSPLAQSSLDVKGGVSTAEEQKTVHAAALQGDKDALNKALRRNPNHVHARNSQGKTPLLLAVEGGHYNLIKLLISWGANLSTRDAAHMTALHHAARHGHGQVLDLFLKKSIGIPVTVTDADGHTPLHFAAWSGSLACCQSLLAKDAAVNARSAKQLTPLLIASAMGHKEVVECLLRHGASVEAVQTQGMTALHLAAAGGHVGVSASLLQAGAKPDPPNMRKQRPLLLAALEGRISTIELLLSWEGGGMARVDAKDEYGVTALLGAALMGHADAVEVLIRLGKADTSEQDSLFDTALHLAAHEGHVQVARALLQHGAFCEPRNGLGQTPLITATAKGHLDVIRLLVEEGGADLEAATPDGRTAVYTAAARGLATPVEYMLLAAKAKADVVDQSGQTPLYDACARGDVTIAAILLKGGASAQFQCNLSGLTCLHVAALRGRLDVVRELLRCQMDVELKDSHQNGALYLAIKEGMLEVAQLLLAEGHASLSSLNELDRTPIFATAQAPGGTGVQIFDEMVQRDPKLNLDTQDKHGYTLLHVAVECINVPMVMRLCGATPAATAPPVNTGDNEAEKQAGYEVPAICVDVNKRDNLDCWTPLHLLCHRHTQTDQESVAEVAETLLAQGAEINARDFQQRTPLHIAAFWGAAGIVSVLLNHKVDVNAKDKKGFTALLVASQRGRLPVVELLLRQRGSIEVNAREQDTWMTGLHYASRNGHGAVVKALLSRGADVVLQDASGRNALALATEAGHSAVTEMLVSHMRDLEVPTPPPDRPTGALHQAVATNVRQKVDIALEVAKVQDRDARIRTALHLAAALGAEESAASLLAHDADVSARDLDGNTPAMVAAKTSKAGVFKLIVVDSGRGAPAPEELMSCLQIAARNGHHEVVSCILEMAAQGGGRDAVTSLLQRDLPGRSLYDLALDNGQETVMKVMQQLDLAPPKRRRSSGGF